MDLVVGVGRNLFFWGVRKVEFLSTRNGFRRVIAVVVVEMNG